ncbi:MAG: DUF2752 domain-containing protein [Pedobacter sp.]|nr:MAG: DUF2752 domain-containing protein [Pedobacter sp.]
MPLLVTFLGLINWLEAHFLACPFKGHTGLDCPGCGFQRSIVALLKGDVSHSFELYPASMPIIALVLFVPAHIKYDFKNGAYLIKLTYALIAAIIILNYAYKIYTHNL